MLDKDAASQTDVATERLIPSDIVQRIPRDNSANALAQLLAALIDKPEEIAARADRAGAFARRNLESWDARVAREVDIIRSAASAPNSLATQAAS